MIIAIDGPAASGKGTLAKRLAQHLGFAYLDTGLIYRAVALTLLIEQKTPEDEAAAIDAASRLRINNLDSPLLRGEEVGQVASKVAALPAVRQTLLQFQRTFAAHPPHGENGVILDGRDIGTVVCPDAPCKIFVTASVEKRAERRYKELQNQGIDIIQEVVLRDMQDRDQRDSTRAVAPLRPAPDAFILDTTDLDADQAFAATLMYVLQKRQDSDTPLRP